MWRIRNCGSVILDREREEWLSHPRKATGAQVLHLKHQKVVIDYIKLVPSELSNWTLIIVSSIIGIQKKKNLMWAAALFPASDAYDKAVTVKTLGVKPWWMTYASGVDGGVAEVFAENHYLIRSCLVELPLLFIVRSMARSKLAVIPNMLPWDNDMYLELFCWFVKFQHLLRRTCWKKWISALEMKTLNCWRTSSCKSICKSRLHWPRTNIRRFRTSRYCRRLYYKYYKRRRAKNGCFHGRERSTFSENP